MPKPYRVNDKWSKKAREEGFRARSVYKLEELDEKFNLVSPGICVLDLGAYPGSFLQYVADKIGDGLALGLDIKQIKYIGENVTSRVCDVCDIPKVEKILEELNFKEFDLILSDLAPKTSGIKYADQRRSLELNFCVFEIAKKFLKKDGKLVMKVFQGPQFDLFVAELRKYFKRVYTTTVQASRERSFEMYIICQNRRGI